MSAPNALNLKYDPRIKPPQWGPLSAVQSAVRHNCDRLGLPHPVGYWPFWEAAGGTAHDLSGNSNHGTLNGGPTWAKGVLEFDGADDYVGIGSGLPTDISNGFSLTAWVKWDGESSTTEEDVVIARWSGGIDNEKMYLLRWDSETSSMEFFANDGSDQAITGTSDTDISDGEWHYIIGHFDGTTMSMYLDGQKSNSTQGTNGSLNSHDQPTQIGADKRGVNIKDYFNGKIDEVRIYNQALSADQIALLYEQPYALLYPPRVPLFFDMGAGGATLTRDTAWRTFVTKSEASAWRILDRIAQESGWAIANTAALDSAWKTLTSLDADTAWRLLTQNTQDAAWRLLNRHSTDTAWSILTKITRDTAWQILTSGVVSADLAWRILATQDAVAAWRIQTATSKEAAWSILNSAEADTAWRTLATADASAAWQIKAALEQDTGYKVFNVADQDLAWQVMAELSAESGWQIFTQATADLAWDLNSENIPEPVRTFVARSEVFAYNARTKTFIFTAK